MMRLLEKILKSLIQRSQGEINAVI
jgi:hypothetical protein